MQARRSVPQPFGPGQHGEAQHDHAQDCHRERGLEDGIHPRRAGEDDVGHSTVSRVHVQEGGAKRADDEEEDQAEQPGGEPGQAGRGGALFAADEAADEGNQPADEL